MALAKLQKLRAVFYARVSTEEDKQLNALQRQIEENIDAINKHEWKLIDQYIDEGKSGTKIKGRDDYQRLLEDLEWDKFDIIVVKSQDRLQRSTKDWYIFIDKLVTSGKKLYFYLEDTFYSPDNALITGIKAILAEEFSRDLSKKINNAHKKRIAKARNGEKPSLIGNGICYGWDFVNGEYILNEEEAKVKKYVADLYLKGNGLRNINRILTAEGYRNREGREFNPVTIRNMLIDTKNYGAVTINKTHVDFDTKRTIKNPESEWVCVENVVPPIYSKETHDKILDILEKRIDKCGARGRKIGSHPLSGKIFCAECGAPYWKIERKNPTAKSYAGILWRCSTYSKNGRKTVTKRGCGSKMIKDRSNGCDSPDFKQEMLTSVLQNIGADLVINKDVIKRDMLEWLNNLIESLNTSKANKSTLDELKRQEGRKNKLTEAYMDGIISKDDYREKYQEIETTITRLKSEITVDDNREEIKEIRSVIENIDSELDKYIATEDFNNSRVEFLLDHINRITVSGAHFIIELDLIAGAILAGENFFQFVKGGRQHIIQTEKQYFMNINDGSNTIELPVILKVA
jgi:DNA invertase Pin-like site-specific DNA recombinase